MGLFSGKGYTRKQAKTYVGKGWHSLLDTLYDAKPKDVVVLQVKEKYGGLRFYIGGASKEYHDLITKVEDLSYSTCERCGKPGTTSRVKGWYTTLCLNCKAKEEA